MEEQWMTVKDVAEYLKVSTDLVYRLAQKGEIPASKVANRWRFRKDRINRWMDMSSLSSRINQVEGIRTILPNS